MLRSAALLALVLLALVPAAASAASLRTFEVTVDVDLSLTQKTIWKGIRSGCFAPAENFSVAYGIVARTRRNSRVRPGTATLVGKSYGTTPTYGADGGFRQFMINGPWELETQNPAGCNTPAPAVPSWATAPLCNRIEEKVSATLLQSSEKAGAGTLVLLRTPEPRKAQGGSIGPSCVRTFHSILAKGIDSDVALTLKGTLIMVPIPDLKAKLTKLAKGKSRAHPSFTETIDVGGDCSAMTMKPTIGARKDFVKAPFSTPHRALGNPVDLATASACMISGGGKVVVRRDGPVVSTAIPAAPR